jgi:hypothetical protein
LNDEAFLVNRFQHLHCHALSLDADRNRETTMQSRDAIKSTRVLVVAPDRWTQMLVRRQAHAFEIIIGMVGALCGATSLQS